jgi:hypothetical protein
VHNEAETLSPKAQDASSAAALIPGFTIVIADIYRRADAASDALSPWLLWLSPDGRLVELFDTTLPMPTPDRLDPEFIRRVLAR